MNGYSRNLWLQVLSRPLFRELNVKAPHFRLDGDAFHVTLIDRKWFVDDVEDQEIELARKEYASLMAGFDFVGMIDVGLYVSSPSVLDRSTKLSIHAHLLVWNTDRQSLAMRVKRINRRIRPFVSRASAAKAQRVRPLTLGPLLGYITKPFSKQYQLFRRSEESLKQWGREISGANFVRLYRQTYGAKIVDLALSGGRGIAVVAAAQSRWSKLASRHRSTDAHLSLVRVI